MDYKQLAAEIKSATKKLREVDESVAPTDDEMDSYERLREAADELRAVTNYILTGD